MKRARAAGIILALGLIAGLGWTQRRAEPPEPTGGAVRVLRDGTEVEVSGPLATSLAAPLRQALLEGARLVQVDSPGGPPGAAEALAAEIRAAGADTAVTDRCLSACVAPFLAGRRRWIGPFAQLGLEARHAGSSLLDLYRRAGVPPALLRDVGATPDGEGWFPTADDLLSNGMATATAAPDQFALAGFGPAPTAGSIRARLLSVPIYRAAASADPAAFEADLAAWHDAVLRGQPGTAAFARTRSTVRALVAAALPEAPDDLLGAYAELRAAEIAWARAHRPEACPNLLRDDPNGWITDPELATRRAALELRLIEGLPSPPSRASSPPTAEPSRFEDCEALRRALATAARDASALRLLLPRS